MGTYLYLNDRNNIQIIKTTHTNIQKQQQQTKGKITATTRFE